MSDLEQAHVKTLRRLREALVATDETGAWSELATNWVDGMIEFLQDRKAPPPQWLHATEAFVRHKNEREELEEKTEFNAQRLVDGWVGLRLSGEFSESKGTDEHRVMLELHRAMTNFIAVVMRRLGHSPDVALRAYSQDLVNETESAKPDVRRGPELTVVVAYFVQASATVGGQADELIDLASSERYEDRLRNELGLPTARVRLFLEGEWGMAPIATPQDLDDGETFAKFVAHAAIALDRLQVAEEVVTRFTKAQFEVLQLPTTGRVILFQAISAPRYKLGQLV